MGELTSLGFIVFYAIFTGILLLIAPMFGEEFGISSLNSDSASFNPLDPLGLITRFTILFSLATSNIFIGIIIGAMQLGLLWALIDLIWIG